MYLESDIRLALIYRWRNDFASSEGTSLPGYGIKKMSKDEAEISHLKRQLAEMRIERDSVEFPIAYTGLTMVFCAQYFF